MTKCRPGDHFVRKFFFSTQNHSNRKISKFEKKNFFRKISKFGPFLAQKWPKVENFKIFVISTQFAIKLIYDMTMFLKSQKISHFEPKIL